MEVLNKSAVILLCAIWEAYCEDLADEALRHLLAHCPDSSTLPKTLQNRMAKELKDDPHDLSLWKLAGSGWKTHMHGRLAALKSRRDFDWNNPKAVNVEKLFEEAGGHRRPNGGMALEACEPTVRSAEVGSACRVARRDRLSR
jgi:hypothetical protein